MNLKALLPMVFSACISLTVAFYEYEDELHTCCASGDPHYYPYDGGVIHFQGTCRYLLTGTCPCSKVSDGFKVFTENKPTYPGSPVSVTRLVETEIRGYRIRFEEGGAISIWGPDGNQILPLLYPFTVNGFTVSQSGTTLTLVDHENNIRIVYSHNHRVCVTVPCKYRRDLCGICGNLDGNAANDVSVNPNTYQVAPQQPSSLDEECYSMQSGGNDYVPPPRRARNEWCNLIGTAEKICPGAKDHFEACNYDFNAQPNNEQAHCAELETFIEGCPDAVPNIFPTNWRQEANCPCTDCPGPVVVAAEDFVQARG